MKRDIYMYINVILTYYYIIKIIFSPFNTNDSLLEIFIYKQGDTDK